MTFSIAIQNSLISVVIINVFFKYISPEKTYTIFYDQALHFGKKNQWHNDQRIGGGEIIQLLLLGILGTSLPGSHFTTVHSNESLQRTYGQHSYKQKYMDQGNIYLHRVCKQSLLDALIASFIPDPWWFLQVWKNSCHFVGQLSRERCSSIVTGG